MTKFLRITFNYFLKNAKNFTSKKFIIFQTPTGTINSIDKSRKSFLVFIIPPNK